MARSSNQDPAGRPAGLAAVLVAVVTGAALAGFASLAFAKGPTTIKTAHNSALGETIVTNAKGRTVYTLSGESSRRFLCKTSTCFKFWPPVKVTKKAKLSAGSGIKGKLGRVHRDGFYQLTLGGRPLYTYSGDSRSGMATGNGIKTFGGTWHVVSVGKSAAAQTTMPTTGTTTTTTTNPYPYPYPTTSTTTSTTPYWA